MEALTQGLFLLFLLTSVDGRDRLLNKRGKKGSTKSTIITFPVSAPIKVTAISQDVSPQTSNTSATISTSPAQAPVGFGGIVWPRGFWEPYAYTGPPVPTVIFTIPPTIDPTMVVGPTSDAVSEAPVSKSSPALSPPSSPPGMEQQQQLYQKSFTADPILLFLKGNIDLRTAQSPLYKTLEDGIGPYLTTEIGPTLLQDYDLAVSFDYLSNNSNNGSASSSSRSSSGGGRRALVVERWVKADIVVLLSLENTNVSLVENVTQSEINLKVQSYFQGTSLEHLRMTMIQAGVDVTAIAVRSSDQAQVDGAQEGLQGDMGTGRSRQAWMIVGIIVGIVLVLGSVSAATLLHIRHRKDRKKNINLRSIQNKFDAESLSSFPSLTLSPAKTPRFRDFSTHDASTHEVDESISNGRGSTTGEVVLDIVGGGDDDGIGIGKSSDELDYSHCTPTTMEEDERLGNQLENQNHQQQRLITRTPTTPTTESSSPIRWTTLQGSSNPTAASASLSSTPSLSPKKSILKKSPDRRPLIVLDSEGPMIILRDDGSLADSTLCDPNEQQYNHEHNRRGGSIVVEHRQHGNTRKVGWRSLFSWKNRSQSKGAARSSSSAPMYYYYSANQSIESGGTSLKTLRDVFLKPDEDF